LSIIDPNEYCGSLDCKWNIQPAYNTFIYAELKLFEVRKFNLGIL